MISNKIMSKIHDILVARLMLGNTPTFTVYEEFVSNIISSEDCRKLFLQFNSTVKNRKNDITNFALDFHGFVQKFNGVEFIFEQTEEVGPDQPIQVSISPASIVDLLTDIAFSDIHSVKEYMQESLGAKEVQIKVTY